MKQMKQMKGCLVALAIVISMLCYGNVAKADFSDPSGLLVASNMTRTSLHLDWSKIPMTAGTTFKLEITYYVYPDNLNYVLLDNTKVTSYNINNLRNLLDGESWDIILTQYEYGEFESYYILWLGNYELYNPVIGPSTSNTPSNSYPSTPNNTTTTTTPSRISLKTPTVAKAILSDTTLGVTVGNVDVYADQVEWKVTDKKSGKVVSTDTTSSSSDLIYGINSKKIYSVQCRVKGYDSDYNEVYSNWSSAAYVISQPKVTTKDNSKDVKQNGVKIKFKKISGAKDYTIYAKTKEKGKWVKITTTKKNSYFLSKIKGKKLNLTNKTVYWCVVANAKVGGKKIQSAKGKYYYSFVYTY